MTCPRSRPAHPLSPLRAQAPRRPVFVVRGRPGPGDRPALPPGSPDTWGAITAGTLLADAPYPFPVFCHDAGAR